MPDQDTATSDTDRIVKRLDVRATRARVWRALADATEFGAWFGMVLDQPFAPGAAVVGRLTIPGYEHIALEMRIEAMEEGRRFAYRWHPYAVDPAIDYRAEPMTLVEFLLEDAPGGTAITIIESGFDALPASRRAEAFRRNTGGWESQTLKLAAHVG